MSMNGGVPLIGEVKMAPPAVVQMQSGERIAYPQVVTAEMSLGLVDMIAAKTAAATVEAIKAEFELFPKKHIETP